LKVTTLVTLTSDVERAHAGAFVSFDPEYDDGDYGLDLASAPTGDERRRCCRRSSTARRRATGRSPTSSTFATRAPLRRAAGLALELTRSKPRLSRQHAEGAPR
jgi:hypothetical protein